MKTLAYWKECEVTIRNMREQLRKEYVERRDQLRKVQKFAQDKQKEITMFVIKAALIFLLGFISGCCTIKGICEDTSWTLKTAAENIQPKQ